MWTKDRPHPLQDQEPLGDRKYIKNFEFLQKLTEFEESIGMVLTEKNIFIKCKQHIGKVILEILFIDFLCY